MGSDGEFSVIKLFENVLKSSMRQGKLSKIVKELRVERKKTNSFTMIWQSTYIHSHQTLNWVKVSLSPNLKTKVFNLFTLGLRSSNGPSHFLQVYTKLNFFFLKIE